MGKITEHNYEAFLLDLSEGSLSGEDQLELETFMINHPDLAVSLENLPIAVDKNEVIGFSNKSGLKKTETQLVSAEQFIAYIEHQLTKEEKRLVEKSCVSNPSLATELKLYQSAITRVDLSVTFNSKESLKRKPKFIWFNFSTAQFAAAAAIALLVTIYVFWPSKEGVNFSNVIATHVSRTRQNTTPKIKDSAPSTTTSSNSAAMQLITKTSLVNNTLISSHETIANEQTDSNTSIINQPDTFVHIAIQKSETAIVKEERLLTLNTIAKTTVVEIISENDEEEIEAKPKKGFWKFAGKALNKLNKAGVKGVDGEENTTKQDATYALTLGNVNITHTTH